MTLRRSFITLFFLLACITSAATPLCAQIVPYENRIVERIEIKTIDNDPLFNTSAVLHMITTREGSHFSQSYFDQDLKVLAREFDSVIPSVQVIEGKLFITLVLSYKPTIRMIDIEGNQRFPQATLLEEMGVQIGQVFDRRAFAEGFQKLKQFYVKKGYFEADFDYTIEKDPVTNDIDVKILVNEGRSGKIKEIRFHGFNSQEKGDILDLMLTKKWHFIWSFFTDDGIYNADMVQQDQMQILNYIQNRGFADAVVTIETIDAPGCDRIYLDISLERGELYHIGQVTLKGNILFEDCKIFPLLQVGEGAIFSPERIHKSVEIISDLYGTYGYIDAIIDFDLVLDEECDLYHVHFNIEEGEQYRVGMIKIFGNCTTENRVILHETLLIPGEIFNIVKLKKTELRLLGIGYFAWVNVYAVKTEDSDLGPCYRDVHIEVEETSTGSFSASFGFSNVETIFGGLSVTEKNFNWKGIPYLFRGWEGFRHLRGNGEYLFLSTTLGSKSRQYGLSWTKPYFMDSQWVIGFDLNKSNIRYVSSDYDVDGKSFTLRANRQINGYVRGGLHYRLATSKINITGKKPSEKLVEESKNSGPISAIGASLVYDSTDSPVHPWEGFRSRLSTEYAGLGGRHHFYSVGYHNSWYNPIGENGVVKIRADVRFLFPMGHTTYETIPINERLFLGTDCNVRGYKAYSLGPSYGDSDDPRGGLSTNLLSWEYAHYVNDYIEGFTFFDAGSIQKKKFAFGQFYSSAGFGVRLAVMGPAGPQLTLGMGYPINEKNEDIVERFFFQIGGNF